MLNSIAIHTYTHGYLPTNCYCYAGKSDEMSSFCRRGSPLSTLSLCFPVSAFPLCHGAVRSLHINSLSSIIDAPIYGTYLIPFRRYELPFCITAAIISCMKKL